MPNGMRFQLASPPSLGSAESPGQRFTGERQELLVRQLLGQTNIPTGRPWSPERGKSSGGPDHVDRKRAMTSPTVIIESTCPNSKSATHGLNPTSGILSAARAS